jgi:peptidoglycan/xylan/chitin deacetylase (PgdA/CDA1 family)
MTADGLIELGSHTHTHADLRGRPEALRHELEISIEIVRELFNQVDVPFAFPYGRRHSGHVSEELLDVVRQSGATCALTTEAETIDLLDEPFGWGRFNVYDWDSGASLAARLAGWYGWAPRLQSLLSRKPVDVPVTVPVESPAACP